MRGEENERIPWKGREGEGTTVGWLRGQRKGEDVGRREKGRRLSPRLDQSISPGRQNREWLVNVKPLATNER